eukprot:106429_1
MAQQILPGTFQRISTTWCHYYRTQYDADVPQLCCNSLDNVIEKISWIFPKYIKIINKMDINIDATFLDPVLDMEFLEGKHHYDMNQNFKDAEKKIKVAVLAGQQATISLGTCILLMKNVSAETI